MEADQKASSQRTCLRLPQDCGRGGKEMEEKSQKSQGRELFVLKDYLLGLSLIFWTLFLI